MKIKILIYQLCLSSCTFAQSCIIGNYPVGLSPVQSYLNFPTNHSMIKTGDGVWLGTQNSVGNNYGLADQRLPASTDGTYTYFFNGVNSQTVYFGFNASATVENVLGYEVVIGFDASNNIVVGGTADAFTNVGTATYGILARITRTGSTFKAQTSSNSGATWTDIYTYTYTSSAQMWLAVNMNKGAAIYHATSTGTVSYSGAGTSNVQNDTLIICDGNSLTAVGYPDSLQSLSPLTTSGVHIINYGVSGQTTVQMSADAAAQDDILVGNVATKTVLIAWEIGNDIVNGGQTPTAAYNHFVSYCQARQAAGWYVIALTLTPRNDIPDSTLQSINTLLLANYLTFANDIVDLRSDSRLATWSVTYWQDAIHLNATGYGIVAREIKPKI